MPVSRTKPWICIKVGLSRLGRQRPILHNNGCGDRAAMFLMDYSMEQKVAYDPVVTRMVRSLKPEDC
ncbi:MAG: hypothetical protein E5Y10_18105 [Mesorhizobium sp.]|nr:MAG: hypothetical protein EOS13_16500 [Mesorhizobium sp.]TIN28634.1 MAG: hypothetical protein E5Y19_04900 [Mesorhizobium sp.]TIN37284.1 MAG: hypothetical protein E5Y13_19975 [Mesorhizobium sp.]TJU85888.1 MAG: hypothetical protein E5Y15_10970 [Mesorhizobium sp.]TJU88403.1 MAG: hypothetical protein E5Y10_18105 [Mesorhizobium sp.]